MPQNTNLNVSPYFDDFSEQKGYQRVLFKPGTPIQSRELTTLQSILQNQIEKFGKHFFKEGSVVIPGQIGYDDQYYSVQIDDSHLGIPVSSYIEKFVGKSIQGEISGVTAVVENYITNEQSERGNYTLYIKYQSSSSSDFTTRTFIDGENLISLEDVDYTLSTVQRNTSFATAIISNSTSIGSAAKIEEGVYFIRGFFLTVSKQTIILDQYNNSPSYRVGLFIDEEIAVSSNTYNDLFDNAQGFSNYSAPGADRLKISLNLIKKPLDDFNDENFVELMRLDSGILVKFVKNSDYNLVKNEFARRTYDESGDYYVRPFNVFLKESLNDKIGNSGVYSDKQKTSQGNSPSNDLACLSISPGKAYVRGYEIETISNVTVDVEKPRTTEKVFNSSIPFNVGRKIVVNNVFGSIPVGFGSTSQVSLYSDRTSSVGVSSGSKIGIARVYDFKLKNAEYSNSSTQFELFLYDVQTYTKLTLNSSITLNTPAFIEGRSSGASAYLANNVSNSSELVLYQVSGSFISNEQLKSNGENLDRVIVNVNDYNLSDVHQITANESAGIGTFTSDPLLSIQTLLAPPGTEFTISSSGTVTSGQDNFYVGIKVGDIVSYTKQGDTVPTYNKVSAISTSGKNITITPTTSVSGICSGTLPATDITTSGFKKVSLEVLNNQNAFLYSRLNNLNVSTVDLTGSEVIIRKSYQIPSSSFSSGAYSQILETDPNLTLLPFDEEDYNLSFSDGTIPSLDDQKLTVSGRTISIQGITPNSNSSILTVTFKKTNVSSRKKLYNRCSSIVVNKTSSGINTSVSGLTKSSVYGLRVEDKEISLNVPDVESIIGVFESSTSSDPILPNITLTNLNSNILNLIKGERISGSKSNAVAVVVSSDSSNVVEFVYLNENSFYIGEDVTFEESKVSGKIDSIIVGDRNIRNNYILDEGQKQEYLDFSKIIRKNEFFAPIKKLKIIFNNYTINSADDGDLVSVDSYGRDRYGKDISFVGPDSLSDIIDLRPRVAPYSGSYSPFEYQSRNFELINSSKNIFSNNKDINLSYEYYLPRIDKLYLNKDGIFFVSKGIPSIEPKEPNSLDSALEVATIRLPAYLYNTSDASIILSPHKRYTMRDVSKLEDRIKNIEYYTSLSLLESDTQNLSIRDPETKLDRFKCGFFVDNFRSSSGGQIGSRDYKASIDTENGVLRPPHYTPSIDLLIGSESVIGLGTITNPNADLRFVNDFGSPNVKKVGSQLLLNYTEVEYVKNIFATRSENVNPFNVINWIGSIELNPSSDSWIETRKTEKSIDIEGNYQQSIEQLGVDTNTGLSPIDWNSWETNWTGQTVSDGPELGRILQGTTNLGTTSRENGRRRNGMRGVTDTTKFRDNFLTFNNQTITKTGTSTREGIQYKVSEKFDSTNLGDRVVSREIIKKMRSRNIEIIARKLKPSSRFYCFFDDTDLTSYVIPKLLEVSMKPDSGTFVAGETVVGTLGTRTIKFRLSEQNHKYGPYLKSLQNDTPSETYIQNPYQLENTLSDSYSSTTTILNVDTASLSINSESNFYGSVAQGMQLVGQSSQAVATVSEIRLISDSSGGFIGSLLIPDSTIPSTPSFETGRKTLVLTTSPTNSTVVTSNESTAETNFYSEGSLDVVENSTLRIRNANIERLPKTESKEASETETRLVTNTASARRTTTSQRWVDPLAQSFEVADRNGVFITKCDIYFRTKDTKGIPVTLQIRTMRDGTPTQEILPFGEVVLDAKDVNISEDGTIPTTFTFPSPIYLEPVGSGYAIVLLSSSNKYNVWISMMGETDVSTIDKPKTEKIVVSQQPTLGSLFKSQNGSTWDPSQLEDLKFTLYRADFVTSPASIRFYNPELGVGNNQIVSLRPNPINTNSNSALVGIGTSLSSAQQSSLVVGNTISQTSNANFTGKLKSLVGAIGINSTLTLTNAGIGFTSGPKVYSNINLKTLTGFGNNAKVSLSVSGGVAVAATVTDGGFGYKVGDTLTVNSSDTDGFGKNLILTIPNNSGIISSFNSLVIENIQGRLDTSGSYTLINNGSEITNALVTSSLELTNGLYFKVNHNNHGMYAANNQVILSGIESDYSPETLISDYSATSTDNIVVSSGSIFTTFENVAVSPTNPGYVLIDQEIIRYTGVSGNSLTGITGNRGVDGTIPTLHTAKSLVFKYEMNGISLRRINKTHTFTDVDVINYPIEMDSYYLKVDTSSKTGTDRTVGNAVGPELFFNQSKSCGSYLTNTPQLNSLTGPKATQNIVFNSIRPNIITMLPDRTSIDTKIRTTSATSVNGNEISFIDNGFDYISLNSNNEFRSSRMICSKVNEDFHLSSLPGNKSLTIEMSLETKDSKVSPVIDFDRVSLITTMNRIDSPVKNYLTDPRVNQLTGDPNSAIYLSKIVKLEKSSDNLKVLFDAYRHQSNDIRVLYRLLRNDTPDEQQVWEFFPGYDNLDQNGNVIDPSKNNGNPDRFVQSSNTINDYGSYEFTAKNLPLFNGFQVKIIMAGTNQSQVPLIKDLRIIATI
jgi:hypothetical protein